MKRSLGSTHDYCSGGTRRLNQTREYYLRDKQEEGLSGVAEAEGGERSAWGGKGVFHMGRGHLPAHSHLRRRVLWTWVLEKLSAVMGWKLDSSGCGK